MSIKFTLVRVGSAKALTLSNASGPTLEAGSLIQFNRVG